MGQISGLGTLDTSNVSVIASAVMGASAVVANTAANADIPAVTGSTGYISSFQIMAGGATGGAIVNATLTGVVGGTVNYPIDIPTGATTVTKFSVRFDPALPASAPGVRIRLSLAAAGTGNTAAMTAVQGFYL